MAIYEVLKDVAKALKEADKIELYSKILDVQQQLMDMQNRIQEITEENLKLKNEINKKHSLIPRGEVYFLLKDDGNEDGPFCAKCQDVDGKLVRMNEWHPGEKFCPNCRNAYKL